MKESRRHRWIGFTDGNKPRCAVCRDCGLETMADRVKAGGLGECPGKMAEHQCGLSLLSGDPHSLGNRHLTDALLACAGCGKAADMMLAHRNAKDEITGCLFTCGLCFLHIKDHDVVIRPHPKDAGESEEG